MPTRADCRTMFHRGNWSGPKIGPGRKVGPASASTRRWKGLRPQSLRSASEVRVSVSLDERAEKGARRHENGQAQIAGQSVACCGRRAAWLGSWQLGPWRRQLQGSGRRAPLAPSSGGRPAQTRALSKKAWRGGGVGEVRALARCTAAAMGPARRGDGLERKRRLVCLTRRRGRRRRWCRPVGARWRPCSALAADVIGRLA